MNILFIGDIIGKVGREMLTSSLPSLISRMDVDFTIVNGENAAAGFGLTTNNASELFSAGVNVITSGNHIWRRPELVSRLMNEKAILRPANYPPFSPGSGRGIYETKGVKVGVINLLGRIFMDPIDCPFTAVDREMEKLKVETNVIIVDMHAEATSEKIAMGWYLDGKVSAVLGTHTHVQTADERILPNGTAYITDAGMTGPIDSVIGVKKEIVIKKFITGLPSRFEVADGKAKLEGVLVEVDPSTGRSSKIKRIQLAE